MGKKGGVFKGVKPQMRSSFNSFSSRGLVMTTRDSERLFGRNLQTEDAERDADRQRYRRKVDKAFDAALANADSPDIGQFTKAGFNQDLNKGSPFNKRKWHEPVTVPVEIRRRKANLVAGMHKAMRAAEPIKLRMREEETISCPHSCGYSHTDSRMVARHIRQHSNACCRHVHCNCEDCKRSRNEV